MADFIAVIRRAVDGLSENTPEMRAKVYERARSAVVRQLENMKPRPPETMFQKQLDKLDAAIREVEADHAEALAPQDVAPEALAEELVQEQAAAHDEPSEPSSGYDDAAHSEQLPEEGHQAQADADAHSEEAPVYESDSAYADEQPEPAAVADEPAEQQVADADEAAPYEEPAALYAEEQEAVAETVDPEEAAAADRLHPDHAYPAATPEEEPVSAQAQEHYWPQEDDHQPAAIAKDDPAVWPEDAQEHAFETPEPAHAVEQQPAAVPDWSREEEPHAFAPVSPIDEPAPEPQAEWRVETIIGNIHAAAASASSAEKAREDVWSEDINPDLPLDAPDRDAPQMPRVAYDEVDVVTGFNAFVQEEMNRQVVPPPPGKKPAQDDFGWGASFDDLPDLPKTEAFDEALKAKQMEIQAPEAELRARKDKPKSARAELAEVMGVDDARIPDAEPVEPLAFDRKPIKLEGKTFRHKKQKKGTGRGLRTAAIAAGLVLVLGGAAYGLWTYKDDVSKLIASLTASKTQAPAVESKATTSTAKETPKSASAQAQPNEVASLDNGPQKFTQRLMPDGSEVDAATKVSIDEALPEGKTVAGQTEASKEVASTDAAPATTTGAAANGQAQTSTKPLGVTQKMFLYEERLGQSTPSATPGTVSWSEGTEDDGEKPVASIQAKVDAPGRGMTALITFKKNMDPSLPASHIVEVVFGLPKDFAEGNVESVQRIAFKRTEQDPGDQLIAVPAKITDDYHMVALNNDADAQKVNLDLMKNRGWIDIPITYRNGRRALITIEKGASGSAVFDKVLGEWAALGPQAGAQ